MQVNRSWLVMEPRDDGPRALAGHADSSGGTAGVLPAVQCDVGSGVVGEVEDAVDKVRLRIPRRL